MARPMSLTVDVGTATMVGDERAPKWRYLDLERPPSHLRASAKSRSPCSPPEPKGRGVSSWAASASRYSPVRVQKDWTVSVQKDRAVRVPMRRQSRDERNETRGTGR